MRRSSLSSAVLLTMLVGTAFGEGPLLELQKGDRIVLVGNTLAERMQYFGRFETLLEGLRRPRPHAGRP